MNVKDIIIGSWFQRTSLHLVEIYDFLIENGTSLELNSSDLKVFRGGLNLTKVEVIFDDFEYVYVESEGGISFKIYEDGLIVLSTKPTEDTKRDIRELKAYYEERLSPAIEYIFSLGAAVPKELANIKEIYPYFIVLENEDDASVQKLLDVFGGDRYFQIKEDSFDVYRGDKLYVINSRGVDKKNIERFVEEMIFIREFKGQLHRYLNLHRIIWENISSIKERGSIKGRDIQYFKTKVDGYKKSLTMIDTRINQMGTYVTTRGKVFKNHKEMNSFIDILQFKHETLSDTLSYIKELWTMTVNYVDSTVSLFDDLQAKATNASINNLAIITSMGVGATLFKLFTADKLPSFSLSIFVYLIGIILIGWFANVVMKKIYQNKNYFVRDIEADKDIF